MCLVVIAHRLSSDVPLVLAANRDEDHQRPTLAAGWWEDAPEVVGGRDALQGGSWLALARSGRFAAVTNLRGAIRTARSRGALVRGFVTSRVDAGSYAAAVVRDGEGYAGFHLVVGDEAGELFYASPRSARRLPPGIHAFSNAPPGEEWPKVGIAVDAMQAALSLPRHALVDHLMRFLGTSRGAPEVSSEIFVSGERYGTRSSAVVAQVGRELVFTEQSWGTRGVAEGERKTIRFERG